MTEMRRAIRWGDLISPRAMYEFTLADAWGSLPTLFTMTGMFVGIVLVIYLVKKLLEWLLLPKERFKKYVLDDTHTKNAQGRTIKVWRKMPTAHWGSIVHITLETIFFMGVLIAGLFAASIGGINIWESAIASVGIGIIGTYVLGTGLQQLGSSFFFFATNAMSVDEYWTLVGGGIEGRVSRITPFFVEMMCIIDGHGCLNRVSMTTALTSNWRRDYFKEAHEPRVVMDGVKSVEPPPHVGDALLGDDGDGDGFYEHYDEDEKKIR